MTTIVPLCDVTDDHRGGVISIGNFDGVHRGHARLLSETRRLADRHRGPAAAVVLDPHPAVLLRPESAPARLTWIERRAERMSELGIDYLIVCETTRDFLRLSAETFFESLVVGRLSASAVVEGPNFFFGRDRGGDVELLRELCRQSGTDLSIVEPANSGEAMISSTRIRETLAAGAVDQAAQMLGAFHRVRGDVVGGAKRGRTIGFPTANLEGIDVAVPKLGVYGGYARVGDECVRAAIHLGPNPTFEDDPTPKVEVHLLDFSGDLYGDRLLVDFALPVRDIARFDSADQLADQLARDVETIRTKLPATPPETP